MILYWMNLDILQHTFKNNNNFKVVAKRNSDFLQGQFCKYSSTLASILIFKQCMSKSKEYYQNG